MREYIVPFSTREETPFIFGITIREMFWIGGGFFIGLFFAAAAFFVIGTKLQNIIFCLPVIIPFIAVALYLARKQVVEDDHTETLDRHLIKMLKYRLRCHKYLNFRQGE
ncbi:type IV secretory pathway VirB3-like protein [Desulfohalotomaculum tongense]|uniref:PrgI family mobile element protein n=1 Tax=Desulforadius tongensis TaxID=1216062 RepID=UPI001959DE33|nr:PrgI family protein [Desulforadius tongensis]MBM7854963.1 type IV secretory pathway VirB3-like protein [Desulforadius tongensis]